MFSNSTRWKDLEFVTRFPKHLWIYGPRCWIRSFYNNLGLRFDLNGNMDWSQFWPPQFWMFHNFLWNSGLARRSRVITTRLSSGSTGESQGGIE